VSNATTTDQSSRAFESPVRKALLAVNPFDDSDMPHVATPSGAPQTTKSQQIIGHVRVVVSSSTMLAKQRQRVLVGAAIALAALGVTVLLGLSLAMSVTKPLARTIAAVRAIRGGNYAADIRVSAGGEIGELQTSLKEMADRLAESARDLEKKVAERTRELAAARDDALKSNAERKKLIENVTSLIEEERRQIATEIHDHLNAQLIVIRLAAQRIATLTNTAISASSAHEIGEAAKSIVSFTSDLYKIARHLVQMLRPEIIDALGLRGAVEEMIRQYNRLHPGCHFLFEQEGEFADLGDELSIAAYRLIQEALSNVVKHAAAKTTSVSLQALGETNRTLKICVRDDGVGFDLKTAESGVGLIGMRERVQSLGGQLAILTTQGIGTTITIELPIPPGDG